MPTPECAPALRGGGDGGSNCCYVRHTSLSFLRASSETYRRPRKDDKTSPAHPRTNHNHPSSRLPKKPPPTTGPLRTRTDPKHNIKTKTLLTQARARAFRAAAAPAAAVREADDDVVIGAARGAVERHSRPSPLPHLRTPRAASPRTWCLLGSPAVEVQTDTRRAAGPGAAAASSWEAAARAAAWVWSVRPTQVSSPRPELVYCALRVAIALLHRHLTRRGRGWGRLRV